MNLCRKCNGKGYLVQERENDLTYESCPSCGMVCIQCSKDHKFVQFYGRSILDCPVCAIKRLLQAREVELDKLQRKS